MDLKEIGYGDSRRSGYGLVPGPCEHDNEPLGSKKGGEFFYYFNLNY
jgi:hypothetical protein